MTTPAPHNPAPGLRLVFHKAPAQSLERNFLFTVPCLDHRPVSFSSVETLRRTSGQHASPVLTNSIPSLVQSPAQDVTAPPSLSLLGAVEAHAFELPDVLALTSGPLASTQAAVPLSRTALALLSSWLRTRTVSFSSVETLRRPLVCTLPLSSPPRIITGSTLLKDLTAPPSVSLLGAFVRIAAGTT
jgi:hypothetical protein